MTTKRTATEGSNSQFAKTQKNSDKLRHLPQDVTALEVLNANRDANVPTVAAATLIFMRRPETLKVLTAVPVSPKLIGAGSDPDFSPATATPPGGG